eukprot:9495210-Pyramimonas_sp.AAC.1
MHARTSGEHWRPREPQEHQKGGSSRKLPPSLSSSCSSAQSPAFGAPPKCNVMLQWHGEVDHT